MARSNTLAYAAFTVVCIVWGTTYLAIRVAVRTIPPLLLTGARFTVAGAILFTIARMRGDAIPRTRRLLGELAIAGVLLICIGNFAVVWAEQWVPSGLAALFVATAPFWNAAIERMHEGGDRIDTRRLIGIITGFIGVALLVTPGGAGGAFDTHFVLGALGIQAGAIAWQWGTVRAKYNLHDVTPLMSSAMQMLTGGVAIGVVGLATGETRRLQLASEGLMALAYLTLFGSVLAYTSYVYALRHMRTTNMSLYAYVNPLVAGILGAVILHERLTWISILAMIIILGGVAIVQTRGMPEVECIPSS